MKENFTAFTVTMRKPEERLVNNVSLLYRSVNNNYFYSLGQRSCEGGVKGNWKEEVVKYF